MMNRLSSVFGWNRPVKLFVGVFSDALFLVLACFLASYVRLESFDLFLTPVGLQTMLATVLAGLVFLNVLGIYRTVIRFSGAPLAQSIAIAVFASAIALPLASFFFQGFMPRTVPIIYGVFAWCGITLPRFAVRSFYHRILTAESIPVAIYGAGDAGRRVQTALKNSNDFRVMFFVDDDRRNQNVMVHNLQVYGFDQLPKLIRKYGIQKIILAMPGIHREMRNEILANLEPLEIEVLTIPNLSDLLTGKAKIDEVQQVDIFDLLGRERIDPNSDLMERNIEGKSVLVTGAGGSIGSELCRQLVFKKPSQLVMFEKNEYALFSLEQELRQTILSEHLSVQLFPILGSIQSYDRVSAVFKRFKTDTIYHAAAYKHVPMVEHNVVEGIRNNIFGTYHTVMAANDCGVKNFVLVSTDKAVRPTNIMGATKRYAELICQAFADDANVGTNFSMVRFGNVLGSSGSVVPLFREQIKMGGPVTVTHKDITRYFMTIPEAAQLVIQAGAMAKGGEVFVLDMGEPVKIVDLATRMVHLSGLSVRSEENPNGAIDIVYTGLRPGEKLYEELLVGGDVEKTEHNQIMMANEMYLQKHSLLENLHILEQLCVAYDIENIRSHLQSMPLEFFPVTASVDLIG